MQIRMFVDSIHESLQYQRGKVFLGYDTIATLSVPKGYKYLDSISSSFVMTELWGNSPAPTYGLLFPDSVDPLSQNFTFAIDITYNDDGYIDDENSDDIDSDALFEHMIEDADIVNQMREKQGYPRLELIDWASKPFYNKVEHKLHWAKEYKVDQDSIHTLNYNIRILGRYGYLNLNVIGNIDVLPLVQSNLNEFLDGINFNQGYRYEDFDPKTDSKSEFSIEELILGKKYPSLNLLSIFRKTPGIVFFILLVLAIAIVKRFFFTKS